MKNTTKTSKPTIIILGITGDLSKKKLIPAVYRLINEKKLNDFSIIGIGRRDIDKLDILKNAKQYTIDVKDNIWNKLEKRFHYFKANLSEYKSVYELHDYVNAIEEKNNLSGERIFYMATSPELFIPISKSLNKCKLGNEKSKFIFEKPFGNDIESAVMINKEISKLFDEKQIYRIDHYLGKEIIQNISIARFNNEILEPLWNTKYIDHVQIVLNENFGIESRGAFYDSYGAIRDVVQNHMLQILSLVGMERPKRMDAKNIREEKVNVLKAIPDIKKKDFVKAQYEKYTKTDGVNKNSTTETFVAMKLLINNERWNGVPFYLLTGKEMSKKTAYVYIEFRQLQCQLMDEGCIHKPNYLILEIQPKEGFYFQLNAKAPGSNNIEPVKMEFSHSCSFGPNSPEAYQNLFEEIINGNQSMFVRSDEIEEQWRIIDSINTNNSKNNDKKKPLEKYEKGNLPKSAIDLIQKDGREWHID